MTEAMIQKYLAEYNENGCVVVPGVVPSDEVDALFRQVNQVMDESIASTGIDPCTLATTDQKYLYLKEKFPSLKSHAYDLFGYLDALRTLSVKPVLLNLIRKIHNSPIILDGVRLRIDDTANERLLPLHQEVWGQISFTCVTVWVPLQDVRKENGALLYVPGSHKKGLVPHCFYPKMGNAHGVHPDYLKEVRTAQVEMKKGDALIFHPELFHGSAPNSSTQIRWTFITRYNSVKKIPYLQKPDAKMHIPQKEDAPQTLNQFL